MNIFLSYSSKDKAVAHQIQLALISSDHYVFFDKSDLEAGADFHTRIREAINSSEAFIFLISPSSISKGCYALTELEFAKKKWPKPWGAILPVMVVETAFSQIDAYLGSVTILEPVGNVAAEVAAVLANWSKAGAMDKSDKAKAFLEESKKVAPAVSIQLSAALQRTKKRARTASRRHAGDSALNLWNAVLKQAMKDGNQAEAIGARLETILVLAWNEPDRALALVDKCLEEAKAVDLGNTRARLLQLIGEVHRVGGDPDQARGFLMCALEFARSVHSKLDEGFALLSLSLIESDGKDDGGGKALELLGLAYDAFSAQLATGETDAMEAAKDGYAQAHCCRAELLRRTNPEGALAELTKALAIFESLNERAEWTTADTLLRRAELHTTLKDSRLASADLDDAVRLFHWLKDTIAVAKCHLQAGELLDAVGRRTDAAVEYQQASVIASEAKDARKAAYFHFRYACKLTELRKYKEAEGVLGTLAGEDWLRGQQKIDVMSLLCLVAQAENKDDKQRELCAIVLALIEDELLHATTAQERRSLEMRKGAHLEMCDQHDDALRCFRHAQERCEATGDTSGLAECLSQIRGVMQALGDHIGEREAAERLLSLDEKHVDSLSTALTLVTLAQLNITDQRFSEARMQLDRAEELAPDNPVVVLVGAQIRSKLPRVSLYSSPGTDAGRRLPKGDIQTLVEQLHAWCDSYPSMCASIVSVWYYIHRHDLQELFRSMLGVKFLICVPDPTTFDAVEASLRPHGDMFVWGTNFALKTEDTVDIIPVPEGFFFPAGVKVVTPAQTGDGKALTRSSDCQFKSQMLRRSSELDEAYYLFLMATPGRVHEGIRGITPHFGGRRRAWADSTIVDFMLKPLPPATAMAPICLPLSEQDHPPNLGRVLQVARDSGAIPVFEGTLPQGDGVSAVCDVVLDLPTGESDVWSAIKEHWLELLLSSSESPKPSLIQFRREIDRLMQDGSIQRLTVKLYQLQYRIGVQEFVHPALVLNTAKDKGQLLTLEKNEKL